MYRPAGKAPLLPAYEIGASKDGARWASQGGLLEIILSENICAGNIANEECLCSVLFPRQLKREFPSAAVFSTDDYFMEDGTYAFDPDCLEDAHKWNQKRGKLDPFLAFGSRLHLKATL